MDPNKSMAMAVAAASAAANADPSLTDINYLNLQTNYIKSRSIGVLWAVFSMSFAIIDVIVLVQPQWLGDTELSRGTGYFGLWKSCRLLQDGQDLLCTGKLNELASIQTTAFKVATVFVALSSVLILFCLLAMLLFFFAHPCSVFQACGWLQFGCALCLLSGVLIFPAGWDSAAVKEVCGPEAASYNVGQCSIRWAYILAIIGVLDCFILSILAFVLGARHTKLLPDQYIQQAMLAGHTMAGHQASRLGPSKLPNGGGSMQLGPHMFAAHAGQLAKQQQHHGQLQHVNAGHHQQHHHNNNNNNNKSASSNPLVYWK